MECWVTWRVSGPCSVCGSLLDEPHVVGVELFCAAHCAVHGAQASLEWEGERPAETVEGKQEKLF